MKNGIKRLAALCAAALCYALPIMENVCAAAETDADVPQFEEFSEESETNTVREYRVADPIAENAEGTEFAIVPVFAGRSCLDRDASSGLVQICRTHRSSNQRWTLRKAGGYYMIVDKSGKAIAKKNDTAGSGTQLVTKAANQNDDTQLWQILPAGDGSWR